MDEAIADNWFGERGEQGNSKSKIMQYLNQDAYGRFLEGPNHMHPFRPSLEMVEMNFNPVSIDDLF